MDDFIDDGEDDGDYSSEIKKIFGYDKSRFDIRRFSFVSCSNSILFSLDIAMKTLMILKWNLIIKL